MTPAMVSELASCDYEDSVEAHSRAIRQIIETGHVPFDLRWEPSEVCGLWSWRPDEMQDAEHVINIFACSVHLLAGSHPDCTGRNMVGEALNEKLASLIWSAFALPDPPLAEVARFLAWLAKHGPADETRAFAFLGCLIVESGRGASPTLLEDLAASLERAEAQAAPDAFCDDAYREHFVLRLTNFDQHHRLWIESARRVIEKHAHTLGHAPEALAALARVADAKPDRS